MSHIRLHPVEMLIWLYAFVCPRWRPVAQVREGHHRGRYESRSIARVPLVVTPTSRSAIPFDEGKCGTDVLIRLPLCSQYSLFLPATSFVIRVVKHDSPFRSPSSRPLLPTRRAHLFGSQREHPACTRLLVHQRKSVLATADGLNWHMISHIATNELQLRRCARATYLERKALRFA